MVLTCYRDTRAFSGRGEFCVFHCMLCRFVSGSCWKHNVSSLLMTLSNISALRKRSDKMWSRRCFWSCVKTRGTIFAEIFLIPKSSFTICHTVSLFIFNSSAITLTPNLRSEYTKVRTLLRFTSTFTNLHTKLHVYPLLQILVTHFSANRVPRTRTTSSAARKRTIHLVCGSCKRKLEHVQTCLSTRVWLTQHPSDTLRLFREFVAPRTKHFEKLCVKWTSLGVDLYIRGN